MEPPTAPAVSPPDLIELQRLSFYAVMAARSFLVIRMANFVILAVKLVFSLLIVPLLSLVSIGLFSDFMFHYLLISIANVVIEFCDLLILEFVV